MNDIVIKQYHGLEEIRQITYHSLQADGTLRIYEMVYASLNELFDEAESNSIRAQFVTNNIRILELTNSAYRDRELRTPGFNEIIEVRYIDPLLIKYKSEMIIYNEVVAFYGYGDHATGVEIFNDSFAETQKQIFDQLWRRASRPVIGRRGRSSLI